MYYYDQNDSYYRCQKKLDPSLISSIKLKTEDIKFFSGENFSDFEISKAVEGSDFVIVFSDLAKDTALYNVNFRKPCRDNDVHFNVLDINDFDNKSHVQLIQEIIDWENGKKE